MVGVCILKKHRKGNNPIMFLGAENIMGALEMYRMIWISGRFGGHKTALAYMIAKTFLDRGYFLVSNSRSVWSDSFHQVNLDQNNHLHSVILLDEGGLYFKASRQVEQIASYAAKMDCIYIIPSFWPPAKAAQIINIQPVISLKAAGLPVIVYRWRIDLGQTKEKGFFIWWNPAEIYGIYSRQDPGDDPDEIIKFLVDRTDEYRKRYGRKPTDGIFTLESISEADQIMEAAEIMAESSNDLSAVLDRKSKRRRPF